MQYYGEANCIAFKRSGKPCTNKAYYRGGLCGVHSTDKIALSKNPDAKTVHSQLLVDREKLVASAVAANKLLKKSGSIILSKLRMMREPDQFDGYLKVFPNFNHGGRKDGVGMSSLSPKSIGPVLHGQPGLPPAMNLENLHQGSKVFPQELDSLGNPTDLFRTRRLEMYNDKIPWRHKFQKYADLVPPGKNKNIPLFSVWVYPDYTEVHLSYFESRQIYCCLYEKYVEVDPGFKRLKCTIADGYNIQICGYDAYPITMSLEDHYLDTSKPFGHELVLYCMLIGERPWAKYLTIPNIY